MVELDGMLSIVMPAYNEEKLIYQSIMKTLDIVSGLPGNRHRQDMTLQ